MGSRQALRIEVGTEKFLPLLESKTFKGAHGGRAGMKSYFFGDMHIARAVSAPKAPISTAKSGNAAGASGYRALCLREIQKSIKESSKFLLEQRIQHYGLGKSFEVQDKRIITPGGGEFVFHGLQNHTAESVKSFEGFDVADIEEAQTITKRSLDLLIPTIIRRAGAEIWARWNPRYDTDAIDAFFRAGAPPPNSVCVEVTWQDNPWLSEEVRAQIAADYEEDPERASHIWGGGYEVYTEGAYYARALADLEKAGRIGHFPHDPALPVYTAWDIGVDDYTAIWFFQENGRQVRAIDYYETSGDGAEIIIEEAIKPKPWRWAAHYMPHDVKVREWGAGAKSRYQTLLGLGLNNIRVGVAQGPAERINASRAILPVMHFNEETTRQGIKRLRNYRRRLNQATGAYSGPLHDENSHGADAFGEYAVNCQIRPADQAKKTQAPRDKYRSKSDGGVNWKTM